MFYDAYVISCNGFRSEISYYDGERPIHVATVRPNVDSDTYAAERQAIADDIRSHHDRNRMPLFFVSDHGNVSRRRRVTLRRLTR
jgi:hypothetical protein